MYVCVCVYPIGYVFLEKPDKYRYALYLLKNKLLDKQRDSELLMYSDYIYLAFLNYGVNKQFPLSTLALAPYFNQRF